MVKCSGISFRLFQEDLADDDWLAETMIKICDIEVKKEQSFWLKLDPKGELHVKIDLNRPMDSTDIQNRKFDKGKLFTKFWLKNQNFGWKINIFVQNSKFWLKNKNFG